MLTDEVIVDAFIATWAAIGFLFVGLIMNMVAVNKVTPTRKDGE